MRPQPRGVGQVGLAAQAPLCGQVGSPAGLPLGCFLQHLSTKLMNDVPPAHHTLVLCSGQHVEVD